MHMVTVRWVTIFTVSAILFICEDSWGSISGNGEAIEHWSEKRIEASRGIGYKKKKNRTDHEQATTTSPTWRPKQNGKLMLAKQKGLKVQNLSEIPEDDPDFIHAWADDYYDNYDFEHVKNMVLHGTFESRIQNYYKAELAEAMAKYNTTKGVYNDTYEETTTTIRSEVKPDNIILNSIKTTSTTSMPQTESGIFTTTTSGHVKFKDETTIPPERATQTSTTSGDIFTTPTEVKAKTTTTSEFQTSIDEIALGLSYTSTPRPRVKPKTTTVVPEEIQLTSPPTDDKVHEMATSTSTRPPGPKVRTKTSTTEPTTEDAEIRTSHTTTTSSPKVRKTKRRKRTKKPQVTATAVASSSASSSVKSKPPPIPPKVKKPKKVRAKYRAKSTSTTPITTPATTSE